MTCSAITWRGWVCGRLALGRDGDGRPVCGVHAPERLRDYLDAVSTLAAYARRRELAATCPA